MNNNNNGQGDRQYNPHKSGGRPQSDANYGPKKNKDRKPQNAGRGDRGNRGGGGGGDRGNRFGGGGGGSSKGGNRSQTEMFSATCSTCNKSCQVPFRPDGAKPVLCSECFGKNKSDSRGGFDRNDRSSNDRPKRDFSAPRRDAAPSSDNKALMNQVAALETKVSKILEILQTTREDAPVVVDRWEVEPAVKAAAPKKAADKAAPKKVVKKTAAPKKTAPKKTVAKAVVKKVAEKKVVKKAAVKKVAPKKVVAKKTATKKPAAKKAKK